MALTKMLNEWNNQTEVDSTRETNEVIRPKAATVIKDWLNNAKDQEACVAEKFLAHLKGEKVISKGLSAHKMSQNNPLTDKPAWRPHTSITYGSFYPENGYGNNTGVFRIVNGGAQKPITVPERFTKGSTENSRRLPDFNQPPKKYSDTDIRATPRSRLTRNKSMDSALRGVKNPILINDRSRAKTARFKTRTKSPVRFSDQIDVIQPKKKSYPSKIRFSANMQRRGKRTGKIPYYSDENLMYAATDRPYTCVSPLPTTSYAYFYASYPYEIDRHGSRAGRRAEKRRLSGEFQLTFNEQ